MVLTWLLTVVGFILIVVEVGGWSTTGDNPHAITGIVTVILCFIQPIGKRYFTINVRNNVIRNEKKRQLGPSTSHHVSCSGACYSYRYIYHLPKHAAID